MDRAGWLRQASARPQRAARFARRRRRELKTCTVFQNLQVLFAFQVAGRPQSRRGVADAVNLGHDLLEWTSITSRHKGDMDVSHFIHNSVRD